jgi:hypothetical protein
MSCAGADLDNPVKLPGSRVLGPRGGQIGTVTTTLKELLGHEPWTVEEFLVENADRFRT